MQRKSTGIKVHDTYPVDGIGGVREIQGASKSFFCGGFASAGAVGAVPFGTPPAPHLPICGRRFVDAPPNTPPLPTPPPAAASDGGAPSDESSPQSPTPLRLAAEQADAAGP